ncbi:MAG TPA: DUF3524 domain-containing protein [Gammaproteobacteria bacterium]|nr:DUF3524 domain-containing protein [Gammaproteobacteria bacterium]
MKPAPTIWLLSAYRSQSHAAWADWLTSTFSEIDWHKLELPGRHFRWRIRGNPLSWLHQLPPTAPDLILATSMVDLSTLKGLHPRLANVPCIYYFHENQFAYPTRQQQHHSVDPQMVQLYGALAADQLLFNSIYNRDSFLEGVDSLLKKLPDEVPDNITEALKHKTGVLPVAINPIKNSATKNTGLILWNHRWEYDKAPQVFADALNLLNKSHSDFQLALLGERSQKKPDALMQIEQQHSKRIIVNQRVSKNKYREYLSQAGIAVSTAIHEFQGLSMLEAVSAGATPVVPDDLCYQEQYAENYRYPPGSSDALAQKLADVLKNPAPAPDVSYCYEENLEGKWTEVFNLN